MREVADVFALVTQWQNGLHAWANHFFLSPFSYIYFSKIVVSIYPLFFFIDRMCVCLYIYCIYPSFVFLSVCVRQKVPPLYTRTLSHTSGLLVTKKKFFLSLEKK